MSAGHAVVVAGSVPGWTVRAACTAAALVGAIATAGAPGWPWIAVAITVVAGLTRLPVAAALAVGALLVAALMSDPAPARTAALVFAVHAIVVTTALATWIPLRSRVVLRALAPSAARFLWMQGAAQLVALGVGRLVPETGPGLPVFAVLGATVVLLLSVGVGLLWAASARDGQTAGVGRRE